nr:hypothetical protein [Tanacetum cinerariifolium]
MRPFGCPVTILNTLDPLGKFDGKYDEGFLVGYSVSSKSFRVFNSRTRIVQETLHIIFFKNKPNVASSGPTWLFDIDTLTKTMNYQPVTGGNQSNPSVGVQEQFDVEKAREENVQQYVLYPVWSSGSTNHQNTNRDAAFGGKKPEFKGEKPESKLHVSLSSSAQTKKHDDKTKREAKGKSPVDTNTFSATGPSNAAVSPTHGKSSHVDSSQYPNVPNMPKLEDITYSDDKEDVEEPKRVHQDLKDLSWIEAMQQELLQFKMQKVWVLVDLPHGKRAMGTKEEGSDYEEVFAPVARIEAIRKVYVCQPPTFEDLDYPNKVYKVIKGKIDQTLFIKRQKGDILLVQIYVDDIIFGLQVKQKQDGIFISQDKHVAKILRKFGLTDRKLVSTPIDTEKPLLKDLDDEDMDVHTYRSIIGSLMYLTSSRPDIMFVVCACAHFQVTPKASHLHAFKRILRYLKGKPHLGLWYPKDLPFNLVAYSDSNYTGASLDKKSTIGGC